MANLVPCKTCGKEISSAAKSCPHCGERMGHAIWVKILQWVVFIILAVVLIVFLMNDENKGSQSSNAVQYENQSEDVSDPLEKLALSPVSDLRPDGELSELFNMGSRNTDIQRDNKMTLITGKIIEWQLPVYEVSKSDDGYKVQTSSGNFVGTFIYITPRNSRDREVIESLKTGDIIIFKGVISDLTFTRNLEIKPAIIILPETDTAPHPAVENTEEPVATAQDNQAENTVASPAEQPVEKTAQPDTVTTSEQEVQQPASVETPKQEPEKTNPETTHNTYWESVWGNDVRPIVTMQMCDDKEFLEQGYSQKAIASIPIERLKNQTDAWATYQNRAVTLLGCWLKNPDGKVHLKMRKKKDGSIIELDAKLDDGSWTKGETKQ